MKAIGEMLRAVNPGNYSLAYVRKAANSNFLKEEMRYVKRVPHRFDEFGRNVRAGGVAGQDHRLSEWEGQLWCEDVLGRLSPRQREVMECVVAGLSNKEIARKLGMSADAVRRNQSDARRAMRRFVGPDGEYRRPAAPALVAGRDVSRAADDAVAVSASLAAPHPDLRAMSPCEREGTAARVEELRELLLRCPAGALGAHGSAVVLASVAAMATARISDRDELAAWKLIRTAYPHLPLGTTGHKQGRVAGENALGGNREFAGSLGTQVVKVFDQAVARAPGCPITRRPRPDTTPSPSRPRPATTGLLSGQPRHHDIADPACRSGHHPPSLFGRKGNDDRRHRRYADIFSPSPPLNRHFSPTSA